jgi:carbon-monoxide dehydrogenase medium subunit
MWNQYVNASNIDEVLEILAAHGAKARIIAGGSDLLLEIEKGLREGYDTLIDVTRIKGLDLITLDVETDRIHIGPMITHNHCVKSKIIRERAFPLAQAAWWVGSPQIRNQGTVVGNLVTASPANDTIPALMALGAKVVLKSLNDEREVPLEEFYVGVRKTVLREDEMVVDVHIPAMQPNQKGVFIKHALRRAQAISLVNIATLITFGRDWSTVVDARVTFGSVAPVVIHAQKVEEYLRGKQLTQDVIERAGELAKEDVSPISDIRSSLKYRSHIAAVIMRRSLQALAEGREEEGFPENPPLLSDDPGIYSSGLKKSITIQPDSTIATTVNGKKHEIKTGQNKTLLHFIRDEVGLTGSKEGCGEGECGACTVILDGKAVMSCLVPAPRAHGAEIHTIEGVADGEDLHPVQEAFIDEGAVQCGFCTPGFIMSAVKLLEEIPNPDTEQIKQAIAGNLCRCTGYYKIVKAIESAAKREVYHG